VASFAHGCVRAGGGAHSARGRRSVRPLTVFTIAYIATRIYGSQSWLILVLSGNKILEQAQARFTARAAARRRPRAGVRPDGEGPVIHGVSVDPALLSERLGLFVIIVLGESVVQVVSAASRAQYGIGLLATAIASFVLLAGMFGLSVVVIGTSPVRVQSGDRSTGARGDGLTRFDEQRR
jgi:hypothetical protein